VIPVLCSFKPFLPYKLFWEVEIGGAWRLAAGKIATPNLEEKKKKTKAKVVGGMAKV
jgi:hypothetical protein